MEPDGTLYAGLAKQIAVSGNWLNLWINGSDWLDKPHLPFWLAAMSFKVFGVSAFAYKLPSFILFIVSLFYCYKLTAVIYSKEIAGFSTLIYATAQQKLSININAKDSLLLFSSLNDLKEINTDTVTLKVLKTFSYFHVSRLNGRFIQHKTRKEALGIFAIALITRKN